MAAEGREDDEQKPKDFDVDGLYIDAALFAEPEAHARRVQSKIWEEVSRGKLLRFFAVPSGPQPRMWRSTTQRTYRIRIGVRSALPLVEKTPTGGRWGRVREGARRLCRSTAWTIKSSSPSPRRRTRARMRWMTATA